MFLILKGKIPEGMVIVPKGFFIMGSNNHGEDERPEHQVYLDSFYIDKFEISAAQYAEFLNKTNEINIIESDNNPNENKPLIVSNSDIS